MRENTQQNRDTLFVMKPTQGAKFALKKWLEGIDFNTYSRGWNDRKGNPGIGLSKEVKGKLNKAGVVICLEGSEQDAIQIIDDYLGYGGDDE